MFSAKSKTLQKIRRTSSGLLWCFGIFSGLSSQCSEFEACLTRISFQIVLKYALNLAPRPIQCLRSNEKFWGRVIHKRCLRQSRQFSFEVTLASRRRAIHRIDTIFTTNSRVNKEVITIVVYNHISPIFEFWN